MTQPEQVIEGVVIKQLVTNADERGFFREIIRETDDFFGQFGQWSHSLMYPGTAKAWHIHPAADRLVVRDRGPEGRPLRHQGGLAEPKAG